MAEYIDKEIAIAKMTELFAEFPNEIGHYLQGRCIGALIFEQAADVVEVKHAYWNKYINAGDSMPQYECSHCGKKPILSHNWVMMLTNYCPNCGAKMDEVTK